MSKNQPCTNPTAKTRQVFEKGGLADLLSLNPSALNKLHRYREILSRWQGSMNLLSASDAATEERFWSRHVYESAQLLPFLPRVPIDIVDLGSGAGFPGMVLAMLDEVGHRFTLIDSNAKKTAFLSHVSRETSTEVHIKTERVENIIENPHVFVARAFAPLEKLFSSVEHWVVKESPTLYKALLIKGSRLTRELTNAQKNWRIQADRQELDLSESVLLKVKHWSRIDFETQKG